MIPYFETNCPGCRREVRVRVAYLGRAIVCNRCNHPFVAGPAGVQGPTARDLPAREGARAGDAPTAEATARRVAGLEDEVRRLRSELEERTGEATAAAEQSRRMHERLAQASDALRELGEQLHAARQRGEEDAEALHAFGEILAERERLRGEHRGARAILESVAAEKGALEQRCRRQARELELAGIEAAGLRDSLGSSEGQLRASRREVDDERRGWEAERRNMIEEADRLRDGLARAELALREAIGSLGSERAEHEAGREALRSEAEGLRGEVEALRLEGEAGKLEVARLRLERDQLEGLLRQADEGREDARRLHSAEVGGLTEALAEARRHREEISGRLDRATERLRRVRDELDGRQGGHEAARRRYRLALEALRSELESERRAQGDRLAADRARHDDELAGQRHELEALRREARGLGEVVAGMGIEAAGRRDEVERVRREAEESAAARELLARRLVDACRDRDDLRARLSEAGAASRPAGRRDGDETATPDPEGAGEAPRRTVAAHLPSDVEGPRDAMVGPPTHRVPPSPTPMARDDSLARWPLPDAVDLDSARRQIELLSGLLRMAEQANVRLSDRLARLRGAGPGIPPDAATAGRAGAPVVGSRADDGRDEVAWHYGVARRAASLARRGGSGGS